MNPSILKIRRIQVSIFMSPINVHVTRYRSKWYKSCSLNITRANTWLLGILKASTENERTTIVLKNESSAEVLYRQIAGALARRIVNYAKKSSKVKQGGECRFY